MKLKVGEEGAWRKLGEELELNMVNLNCTTLSKNSLKKLFSKGILENQVLL